MKTPAYDGLDKVYNIYQLDLRYINFVHTRFYTKNVIDSCTCKSI